MTAPEDRDPVATARRLTDALAETAAELKRLAAYGHRNRQLIITVLISLTLDVILTVAVALVAVQAHNASARASTASASNLALCLSNNAARAQNLRLWNHLLDLSAPKPGETAAQKAAAEKELAGIRSYVGTVFAARNCVAINRTR